MEMSKLKEIAQYTLSRLKEYGADKHDSQNSDAVKRMKHRHIPLRIIRWNTEWIIHPCSPITSPMRIIIGF